jgi:hypothetical protein
VSPSGAALEEGAPLATESKPAMVVISVPMRTRTNVLLRRLDVRQIRRKIRGKRKASGK